MESAPPITDTDEFLLARYVESPQGRDGQDAFRKLVSRHVGLVFGTAVRRCGDFPIAEEVTQNVFAVTAKKAHRLTRPGSLAGWLHRTTVLEASRLNRSERRYRERVRKSAASAATIDQTPHPMAEVSSDLAEELDIALNSLPIAQRNILLLRYYQELSHHDVASLLGKSEPAVRKQTSRALEALGARLRSGGQKLTPAALAVPFAQTLATTAPAAVTSQAVSAAVLSAPTTFTSLTLIAMTTKPALISAAAVAALAAIPVSLQWRENARLNHDLAAAEQALEEASKTLAASVVKKTGPETAPPSVEPAPSSSSHAAAIQVLEAANAELQEKLAAAEDALQARSAPLTVPTTIEEAAEHFGRFKLQEFAFRKRYPEAPPRDSPEFEEYSRELKDFMEMLSHVMIGAHALEDLAQKDVATQGQFLGSMFAASLDLEPRRSAMVIDSVTTALQEREKRGLKGDAPADGDTERWNNERAALVDETLQQMGNYLTPDEVDAFKQIHGDTFLYSVDVSMNTGQHHEEESFPVD